MKWWGGNKSTHSFTAELISNLSVDENSLANRFSLPISCVKRTPYYVKRKSKVTRMRASQLHLSSVLCAQRTRGTCMSLAHIFLHRHENADTIEFQMEIFSNFIFTTCGKANLDFGLQSIARRKTNEIVTKFVFVFSILWCTREQFVESNRQ